MDASNIRWVPPLPAGWEAKYDPNQKRYFFINHMSKLTTWDDPRFSRQAPPAVVTPAQVTQPQTQNYAYGHGAARQQQQQQQQQAEAIPMKHLLGQQFNAGQNYQQSSLWQPRPTQPSPQRQPAPTRPQPHHHYVDDSEEEESSFNEDVLELEVDERLLHKLREQYPSCPPIKIKAALERNCNALRASELDIEAMGFEKANQSGARNRPSSQSNDGNHALAVQRLKRQFHRADVALIRDIIQQCDGDEMKAQDQLRELGFKGSSPDKEATPDRHRDPASEERERQRALASTSPQRATSPKRPSLTAREKETLITKLCREFPNLDRTIVQLAFETAGSTEDKARRMLQFMYSDNSTGTTTTTSPKKTTSPVRQVTSPSRSTTTSPARSAGSNYDHLAALDVFSLTDNYVRPGSSTGQRGSASSSPPHATASSTSASQKQKKQPKQSSTGQRGNASSSPPHATASSASASQEQRQKKQPKHTTKIQVNAGGQGVVTSQTQVPSQKRSTDHYQVFVSENRTTARGPDPDLAIGPDFRRIERYGVQPNGPNRDLRKGPNRSLVKGSQGAMGPDPSLRRGPQANLRRGPQADLCRGPAFVKSPTRVLVSNI